MRRVSVVNHYECVLFIKTIPLEIQFHNFWSFIESLYKELISQSQINIITIDAGVFPTPLVFVGEVCTVPSRRINIHRCAGNTAPSLRVLRHVQPVLGIVCFVFFRHPLLTVPLMRLFCGVLPLPFFHTWFAREPTVHTSTYCQGLKTGYDYWVCNL